MVENDRGEPCYIFDLHLRCGGYAYFSTFTNWAGQDGRFEIREPSLGSSVWFVNALQELGHEPISLKDHSDYAHWLLRRGWALVPLDLAREIMPHWLRRRSCIRGAFETFTDREIASEGAVSRKICKPKRQKVVERDRGRCLVCGVTEGQHIQLTMQHVVPFGHGGETTSDNLVVLCHDCNQKLGSDYVCSLYDLAGLPNGYDLALIRGEMSRDALLLAVKISSDLMHTRCEVY